MITRIQLFVILFIAALIQGLLLLIDGVPVSLSWLRYIFIATTVLVLLLAVFDKWLWRQPLVQRWALSWFIKRPDISGTWRATIISTWLDQSTGEVKAPVEGYMVIRQTFSLLSLRLMTSESASEFMVAEIISSADNTFQVMGVYRNEPKLSVRHRSSIHRGSVLLRMIGTPVTALKGDYWTDQNTSGELQLSDRNKELYDDFEAARLAFNPQDVECKTKGEAEKSRC